MDITALEFAPPSLRSDPREGEHFVQFYETDAFLLTSIIDFVAAGLLAGDAVIVVATPTHREALLAAVAAQDLDLTAAMARGQYLALDAADLMSRFMSDGSPDPAGFARVVGDIVAQTGTGGRRVRIFGEMVALLWAAGRYSAAIRLEELWNDLRRTHTFSLMCGYRVDGAEGGAHAFPVMCAEHSRIVPGESYSSLASTDDRLRAIVLLQQKASALESEIAERKEAEQRFRFLAESVPQKMFTARPNGEIDYCNAQWAEFTGIHCNEMRNWGWTQVIHPDDVDETVRHWQMSIATGRPFQFEHRFRRADGGYRWHLTRASAMRDAQGTVLMWVGSHTDIDDHKRREATLARSIRQRDEFLSAISHDLNTPLTVLRGQAQLLKRRLARSGLDQGAMLRGLEQIESRSRIMAKLVEELLDVTRLRAGEELRLNRERVDLVSLVQSTVREQCEATDNHRVVVRSAAETLIGYWDRVHLQRVVENLVSNGIKYSPPGSEITVTLATAQSSDSEIAQLTVRDHGIGIAEDDVPHIFEWFYRGKNARAGTIGSGLGLAGVRQIVRQHGGSITVSSQIGIGSTFSICLPMASERESAAVSG